MYRIYVSASTQKENIGVANYGTEQDRMMQLADRIAYWLKTQKSMFEIFRNQPNWSLSQTVQDCNNLVCDLFIDNHTNAGSPLAAGTEAYYCDRSISGQRLAQCLFDAIAPLSPGRDRGVFADSSLYASGLYVLRKTAPPAALIEHIYHTNLTEVKDFLANSDNYAKATAKGVCKYFGVTWIEPQVSTQLSVPALVDAMYNAKWISDKQHWLNVLNGTQPANPVYLQTVLGRAVQNR